MSLSDAALHAWWADALEPPDALEVEEQLRNDPSLRLRALAIQPLQTAADPWRIPPPGVLGGAMGWSLGTQSAAVFGGGLRAGDRFEMHLEALSDAIDRVVVVLRRLAPGWTVVFPTARDEQLVLADLPMRDASYVLEVNAAADGGLQRWAVALPHRDVLDWAADPEDRWEGVVRAVSSGEVPVASVEIDVAA